MNKANFGGIWKARNKIGEALMIKLKVNGREIRAVAYPQPAAVSSKTGKRLPDYVIAYTEEVAAVQTVAPSSEKYIEYEFDIEYCEKCNYEIQMCRC